MSTSAISVHRGHRDHRNHRERDHRDRRQDRHDRHRLELEQADSREPYHRKASTVHGWVTKLRGTLSGNETVRTEGMREMRRAAHIREYKRKRESERRKRDSRGGGFLSRLFSSSSSKRPSSGTRRPSTHHSSSRHDVSRQPTTHRSHRDKSNRVREYAQPNAAYMHVSHRTKPHHYGHGTVVKGMITRNQQLMDMGRQMNDRAARERHRERGRRRHQSTKEAKAVRSSSNKWDFHK